MSARSNILLLMRTMVGWGNLTAFYDRMVFPNLCCKILPGYPIGKHYPTRLIPGHLLPGPDFAKPNRNTTKTSRALKNCCAKKYNIAKQREFLHNRFLIGQTN